MFVFAIILAILAVGALVASRFIKVTRQPPYDTYEVQRGRAEKPEPIRDRTPNRITTGIGGVLLALAALFTVLNSYYAQDPGQASVLKNSFTGAVEGYESTQGAHWKAPWVDRAVFDIRNQRVVYTGGDSNGDNSGGQADGQQITVQDGDGVTANIDIAIRYSIKGDSVVDIYNQYLNEDNFRTRLIFNDIRSVVRSVPGQFDTIELLTQRDEVQAAIRDALEERWADDGVIVDDVALQEIRYGDAVTNAFAAAQEAQIAVSKEQANLEATQVSAQQKVVQAQAEADANALLNASLTPAILQQRYLDTLAKLAAEGNLVITDGTGSQVLVQR